MARIAPRSVALIAILFAGSVADGQDVPAPLKTLELNDGDTVVFLGDSITHQCLYTQYVEDFFYTRSPGKRIRFHNAGIGGARAWDALQRFDRDVAAYKPKYVTVLLGMNDGGYRPFDKATFDTYVDDMTEVVSRIEAIGATPILMTPTMYDARPSRAKGQNGPTQEFYNSVLAYYGAWLRDVAERNGHGFVDMWSPLNNLTLGQRKTEPDFTLIEDAVHPGPAGQFVMASAILRDLDLLKPISAIRIDASGEAPDATASGGKMSDLSKTESGLTFTWSAESLPFVVPGEARPGYTLLALGPLGSRETFTVSGLAAGRYDLSIDGENVATFTAAQLADGVELQDNERTPQFRQALNVAELNRRRNQEAVGPLRNDWGRFQEYARIKQHVAEHPEDAAAAEKLGQLEEFVAGLDEKIAKHEAAAKAIEDEIFQVNQPKPRRYEVRTAGPVEKVSGALTLDGCPVARAAISVGSERGTESSGKTAAQGQFTTGADGMETDADSDGRVTASRPNVLNRDPDPEQTELAVTISPGENALNFDPRE